MAGLSLEGLGGSGRETTGGGGKGGPWGRGGVPDGPTMDQKEIH